MQLLPPAFGRPVHNPESFQKPTLPKQVAQEEWVMIRSIANCSWRSEVACFHLDSSRIPEMWKFSSPSLWDLNNLNGAKQLRDHDQGFFPINEHA